MIWTVFIFVVICGAEAKRCTSKSLFLFNDEIREGKSLCGGESVKDCMIEYPVLVKECKICGLTNQEGISHSVIGGKPVTPPHLYPWVVSLQYKGKKMCSGAIITSKFILTAAHCIMSYNNSSVPFKPDEITVHLLTSSKELKEGPAIEKVIPHPDHVKSTVKHDIALLKLKTDIECDIYSNPICLPSADLIISVSTVFTITGWGATHTGPTRYPDKLQMASAKLISWNDCKGNRWYKHKDHTICLKGLSNSSPCYGDSGGALFGSVFNKFIAFGISSFGASDSCNTNYPFIYTSVRMHITWIRKIVESKQATLADDDDDEDGDYEDEDYEDEDDYDEYDDNEYEHDDDEFEYDADEYDDDEDEDEKDYFLR